MSIIILRDRQRQNEEKIDLICRSSMIFPAVSLQMALSRECCSALLQLLNHTDRLLVSRS